MGFKSIPVKRLVSPGLKTALSRKKPFRKGLETQRMF